MPVIKREESPEAPIASIAPSAPVETTTANCNLSGLPVAADNARDVKPTMPQPAKPYVVAPHERLALTAYHGSSPSKYSLAALSSSNASGGVVVPRAPPFAPLPSHLRSAVATAGRVNTTSLKKKYASKICTCSTTLTLHAHHALHALGSTWLFNTS